MKKSGIITINILVIITVKLYIRTIKSLGNNLLDFGILLWYLCLLQGGGKMPKTIIETILNPKYQKEYNFRNLTKKVELCEELKRLEVEIASQLDREYKKLYAEYAEGWNKLHTELSLDTFASGMKFAEIHNR